MYLYKINKLIFISKSSLLKFFRKLLDAKC